MRRNCFKNDRNTLLCSFELSSWKNVLHRKKTSFWFLSSKVPLCIALGTCREYSCRSIKCEWWLKNDMLARLHFP